MKNETTTERTDELAELEFFTKLLGDVKDEPEDLDLFIDWGLAMRKDLVGLGIRRCDDTDTYDYLTDQDVDCMNDDQVYALFWDANEYHGDVCKDLMRAYPEMFRRDFCHSSYSDLLKENKYENSNERKRNKVG